MSIFEQASRLKLRYQVRGVGVLSVEDLWDLSLESLDNVFKSLNKQVKETDGESLLDENKQDAELRLKIEIVKYVFKVKQAEIEKAKDRVKAKARLQKLLELKAQKQDAKLLELSEEELLEEIERAKTQL